MLQPPRLWTRLIVAVMGTATATGLNDQPDDQNRLLSASVPRRGAIVPTLGVPHVDIGQGRSAVALGRSIIRAGIGSRTIDVEAAPAVVEAPDVSDRPAPHETVSAAEARSRALFEQSPVATLIHRDGVVLAANPAVLVLFGYEHASEVLGTSAFEHLATGVREAVVERVRRRASGVREPLSYESVGRHRDGTEFPLQLLVAPIELPDGPAMLVYLTDLTVQRRAEAEHERLIESLRESERNLAAAQRIAGIGSWEWDLATDALRWSDEHCRIFGIEPGTFGGTNEALYAFVHPDDRVRMAEADRRSREVGAPYDFTHRIVRPDGAVRIVHEDGALFRDAAGTAVRMAGTVQDITERVAAGAELARLATVVEQASDAILITEPDGTIVYVNAAFERLSGYPADEILGQNPRILKSDRQDPAVLSSLWAMLRAGQAWSGSLVNRRKDGSFFEVESVISPVRGPDGQLINYVQIDRDVTAERAATEALGRATRGRAQISDALRRLRQAETVEATAEQVCAEIVALPGLDSTSLVAFEADGTARVLAVAPADGVTQGATLPAGATRRLAQRAAGGAWIEERLIGRRTGGRGRASGAESQAFVPVTTAGRLEGLLIAGTADPRGRLLLAERLATLGDLAALAATVLGPGLAARRQASAAAGAIRRTIAERAFSPVFQPIVALADGEVVGYEALTRFADGSPPEVAFVAAEAAGLGLELEAATLEAAIAASGALPPGPWLELNASPAFVLAGEPLAGLLAQAGRPAVLELTEHDAVADYAALRRAIERLGPELRFAVDDAGAGFASLRHILELAPHIVKLDRALVAGIDTDPARQALVVGMGHFAGATGCTLLAEGVERAAEASLLASLGVPLAQGYWFARPSPVVEVAALGARLPLPTRDGTGRPGPRAAARHTRVDPHAGGQADAESTPSPPPRGGGDRPSRW